MDEKKYNDSEDIFSKILRAGRRTYFFDVRSTKAGDYYLTISESKKFTNDDGSFYFKNNYPLHYIYKLRTKKEKKRVLFLFISSNIQDYCTIRGRYFFHLCHNKQSVYL